MTRPLLLLCVAFAVSSCAPQQPLGAERPDMPAFTDGLETMRDFYRFEFLGDGYPGRRENGDVWAHPIYGVYVLNDYLRQYEQEPSAALRDAIETVAHATVARMEPFRGALVFWYDADPERGARLYRRHYSGLTQSYYAVALHRAGEALADPELVAAAEAVFDSLLIPVDKGGVYEQGPYGPGIAEVPQEPASWILNGWQSALVSMDEYAEATESEEAARVVRDSAAAMAAMLPLYDIEELANSRYGLTGFVYLRVVSDGALSDVALAVPGAGEYAVPPREGTRWQNYVFSDDVGSRSVRMNIVVSRISHPRPNVLRFTVDDGGPVLVQAQHGRYEPLSSSPVDREWVDVATVHGPGAVEVEIPWEIVDVAAYPTNFLKEIHGEQVNVYHPIHIVRLQQLAAATGVEELSEWAERWRGYICRWADMELYRGMFARDLESEHILVEPAAFC